MSTIYTRSAKVRLFNYKSQADKRNEERAKTNPGYLPLTWKDIRQWSHPYFLSKSSLIRSANNDSFYVDSLDDIGKNMGDAGDSIQLDHTGWYTDSFQDGLLKGAVIAIRSKHFTDEDGAHFAYMPATYHSDWDGATVYNEVYDRTSAAARKADGYAEKEAEACREDDAKYQSEREIEDLKEELHDLNKETLAMIKDIKGERGYTFQYPKSVCDLVREHIEEAVERRSEIFERIEALKDDYWLAVEPN